MRFSKTAHRLLIAFVLVVVLYTALSGIHLWSLFQPTQEHSVTGKILLANVNGAQIWGLEVDRSLSYLFSSPKLRFADLPNQYQVNGKHVRVRYTIQDVIGGEWGVVLHISDIQAL